MKDTQPVDPVLSIRDMPENGKWHQLSAYDEDPYVAVRYNVDTQQYDLLGFYVDTKELVLKESRSTKEEIESIYTEYEKTLNRTFN